MTGEVVPTTRAEMDAFFAINLYRGVVAINDTRMYWAEDTAVPFVQRTMTRDRFVRLNAAWHISSSIDAGDGKRGGAGADMWSKLQPLSPTNS